MNHAVQISVIIPNLNSPIIDRTLTALRAQQFDLSRVEVLVVGLDEPGLVQEDELVRLIDTGVPTEPARARNMGMRAARGQLLCFTDADCVPAPDWLQQLTAPLARDENAVAGGSVTFPDDDYWTLCDNLSWFYNYLPGTPPREQQLLPSLNLCVSRRLVDEVGMFDERYPRAAGEDAEWSTRMRQAGYHLCFVPQATVLHLPRRATLRDLLQHGYLYGRYSVKIHPQFIQFLRTPAILRHRWSVLLLSPLLALAATAGIYRSQPQTRRYWRAAPGILLSKLAWCAGLARTLHEGQYPL
jgi:GT2 family glycosyltransferase